MDILQALWDLAEPATVEEVRGALARSGRELAHNSVQTMLIRLEQKGWVRRDRTGRAHRFEPTLGEPALVGRAVDGLLSRFFGGSPSALATHLVERGLSARDLKRLRDLVDAYRAAGGTDPDAGSGS